MDWKRMLVWISGLVKQELLLRNDTSVLKIGFSEIGSKAGLGSGRCQEDLGG